MQYYQKALFVLPGCFFGVAFGVVRADNQNLEESAPLHNFVQLNSIQASLEEIEVELANSVARLKKIENKLSHLDERIARSKKMILWTALIPVSLWILNKVIEKQISNKIAKTDVLAVIGSKG